MRPDAAQLVDGRWSRWTLVALDALLLAAATAIAARPFVDTTPSAGGWWVAWGFAVVALVVLAARGLYSRQLAPSILEVLPRVAISLSLAAMIWLTLITVVGAGDSLTAALSRTWLLAIGLVCAGRTLVIIAQRASRSAGRSGRRVLIVGGGEVAAKFAQRLMSSPRYGLTPVGLLEVGTPFGDRRDLPPVVGTPEHMLEVAQELCADHVLLAFSSMPDRDLLPHVRRCEEAGIEVFLVPRMFEWVNHRVRSERVGTLPVVRLRAVDPHGWEFRLKYIVDRVGAVAILLLAGPVMIGCAIAVRLSSPGPILFRQQRVGLDGKEFTLLKFRSMRGDPQSEGEQDAGWLAFSSGAGPLVVRAGQTDRRTTIGRFMRRTGLDELPQLINVVRGEMSLVGPRPERCHVVEQLERRLVHYDDRHRVKCGITGWAQVNGLRGQTSLVERLEYDNDYIKNWSLALDLRILAMTFKAVLDAENINVTPALHEHATAEDGPHLVPVAAAEG